MRFANQACYPGRAAIDAYGNGGFRFAQMSHKGSILCLPSGIYAWDVAAPEDITMKALEQAAQESNTFDLLLFGVGQSASYFLEDIRKAFQKKSVTVETMSTGAAARTYNVLLAEERSVAAALIATP